MTTPNESMILKALAGVEDPELKKSLTDLDMIRHIDIKGDAVNIGICLTVPGCPMKDRIQADIVAAVSKIPGVESVEVQFDVMSDDERARLKDKLGLGRGADDLSATVANVAKRFIAVSSGKGGVGKSTITVNLASALARMGRRVGLLDADVYGFSIPRMLGLSGRPNSIDDKIVPMLKGDNLQVVSMGFFVGEDEPVIWRGPLLHKAISQFLTDVAWSDLEYLFLDLPPGTGDVTITIAQAIPSTELIVVTTPQATATHVAGRVVKLAAQTDLKVLGIIENMAYLETDGGRQYIFGKDGGKQLADRLGVAFLGEIPLMQSICEGSDSGHPVALNGTTEQTALFEAVVRTIEKTHPR